MHYAPFLILRTALLIAACALAPLFASDRVPDSPAAVAAVPPAVAFDLQGFIDARVAAGDTTIVIPLVVGLVLTALFAAFHGFAHGAELPDTSSGFSYGLGFVIATALLHSIGYTLGSIQIARISGWTKATGVGIATVGAVMLVA